MKILIIDDDESDFFIATKAVPSSTFSWRKDASSLSVDVLNKNYDVVLIDLCLGSGVSGYEVCERLKREGLTRPVILHTGFLAVYDDFRRIHAKADYIVPKSTDCRGLIETLEKIEHGLYRSNGCANDGPCSCDCSTSSVGQEHQD
jgi:DNA-binding response OmpR family regulator